MMLQYGVRAPVHEVSPQLPVPAMPPPALLWASPGEINTSAFQLSPKLGVTVIWAQNN